MNEKPRWDDLALFLTVAEHGGLSGAAKVEKLSPATLGRRMLALERVMQRELFVRRTQGYELTEEGRALAEELRPVEVRIRRLSELREEDTLPLVKISAGTWTTLLLLGELPAIVGDPPDIRVRFAAGESVMSIAHREVVIGFRNKRPTEQGVAGRKLSRVEFAPFATESAPDLWIRVMAGTPSARWVAENAEGGVACEVELPRNALDLAMAGHGVALLPTFIARGRPDLVQRGEIVEELSHDQWLVTHQDDRTFPEVRRTLDRLAALF